jgi:hypothetical protein
MAAVAVCALVCALPGHALASGTQASVIVDDNQLIYSSAAHTKQVMQQLHALGVDDVKVSVVWSLVAPDPNSGTKPSFDAADPGAYPSSAWSRYDAIASDAASLGMGVYFQLQGPDPAWAREPGPSQGPALGHMPYPQDFEQFAEAVGTRYSGGYVPGGSSPSSGLLGNLPPLPLGLGSPQKAKPPLPRVSTFEIWNEPNERSWLNPWYRRAGGRTLTVQPSEYRSLVDAGWQGLQASGHSGDTILIGETANEGVLAPVPFVRELYCVNRADLPLRGGAASAAGCPASGSAASFVAAHPGLFDATGYAHHPYAFDVAPDRRYPQRYYVTLQNLGGFDGELTRIFHSYGRFPAGGVPLYLTEWGYETNPPNPFVHTTLGEQETYIDEGEYMTWQDRYVRSLAQFELVDDGPKPDTRSGSRAYWSTFQTGLEYSSGAHKPSYQAFMLPLWLPNARRGADRTVWGQLRPADHAGLQVGALQFEPRGSRRYARLAAVTTSSPEGFLVTHVTLRQPGSLRLEWTDGSGAAHYSRTVAIS